ncbi:MAG: cytochrome c family protein [Deltaproteobacteria bacterium]|nr:cytochrome c family protein [Deltaproteobacteria bacterium]
MNKRVVYMFGAFVITILVFVTAYSQEEMVVVDNRVFPKPERPPAVFVHEAHNETAEIDACNTCHHVYEDGVKLEDESSEGELCSDCHGLEASDGMPGLMKAFHLNCKGCHMELKKGPITCGECHRK